MVRSRCVGLGVACKCYVLLTGYKVIVVDGAAAHVGVCTSRSRGCSERDGPSVVVYDEATIDISKTMFGCILDVIETIFGCSLACAHVYLVL